MNSAGGAPSAPAGNALGDVDAAQLSLGPDVGDEGQLVAAVQDAGADDGETPARMRPVALPWPSRLNRAAHNIGPGT